MGKFPTRPEVELNDSRKAGGRASGGWGSAPSHAYWRRGGLTTPKQSLPEKRPCAAGAKGPFFPLTARVSGSKRQDGSWQRRGVFRAAGGGLRVKTILLIAKQCWHYILPRLGGRGITVMTRVITRDDTCHHRWWQMSSLVMTNVFVICWIYLYFFLSLLVLDLFVFYTAWQWWKNIIIWWKIHHEKIIGKKAMTTDLTATLTEVTEKVQAEIDKGNTHISIFTGASKCRL